MITARDRSRGGFTAQAAAIRETRWLDCSNTNWNQVSTHGRYPVGEYEELHDWIVHGYAARRKSGEVFFNPMKRTRLRFIPILGNGPHIKYGGTSFSCSGNPKSYEYRYGIGSFDNFFHKAKTGGILSGTLDPVLDYSHPQSDQLISDAETSNLIAEVSTDCWDDRGRLAESNLWESIAELDKSVVMLHSIAKSVGTVMDSISASNKPKSDRIRRSAKEIANLWLLYRYGVMPLMMQMQDIVKGMQRQTGKMRQTARGNGKIVRSQDKTYTADFHTTVRLTFSEKLDEILTCRATSLDEGTIYLYERLGLSWKNLATLPWELVNKSFVLDWFVNVGNYLGALVPTPGLTQLGSCYVLERTQNLVATPTSTSGLIGYVTQASLTGGMNTVRVYTKRVTGLQPPSLVINSNFGFSNWKRCVDSLALIVQKLATLKLG